MGVAIAGFAIPAAILIGLALFCLWMAIRAGRSFCVVGVLKLNQSQMASSNRGWV